MLAFKARNGQKGGGRNGMFLCKVQTDLQGTVCCPQLKMETKLETISKCFEGNDEAEMLNSMGLLHLPRTQAVAAPDHDLLQQRVPTV